MPPFKRSDANLRRERPHVHSLNVDSMMREVLHTLGNIDVEYEIRLDRIEQSTVDQDLKSYIKTKIRAAHRERREPYVELLTSLRQRQHRLSFNA